MVHPVPLVRLDSQAGSQELFPFCSAGGLFPFTSQAQKMSRRLGSGWVPRLGSVQTVNADIGTSPKYLGYEGETEPN